MKKLSIAIIPLLILLMMPSAVSIVLAQFEPWPGNESSCSFSPFNTGFDVDAVPGPIYMSGDGSRMALNYTISETEPQDLVVYDVASETLIFSSSSNTSWGDIDYTGEHFVYLAVPDTTEENQDGGVEVMYWENGLASPITRGSSETVFGPPQISDDGSIVVFSADGSVVGDPSPGYFIYIWDAVNGVRKLLDEPRLGDAGSVTDVLISGDGSTVAFLHDASLSGETGLGETQIYLWDAVNGVRLMHPFSEDVSPVHHTIHINQDGSRIVFTDAVDPLGTNADGGDEIFVWDAATGILQITDWNLDAWSHSASLSMDASGNRILFYSDLLFDYDRNDPNAIPEGGYYLYDEGYGFSQISFESNIGWPVLGRVFSADGLTMAMVTAVGWDEQSDPIPYMELFIGHCTSPNPMTAPSNLSMNFTTHFSVDLSWEDNSASETSYLIERSYDGIDWVQVAEGPADSTTYTDTDLFCSITYFYRVRGYRASDGAYSEYSNVPSDFIFCLHQFPPEDMTLTSVAETSISFTWTDRNLSETSYRVERSLDGTNWQEIAVLPADSASYTDNNLSCDTDYAYRVRSYRGSPTDLYSDYSEVLEARTFQCLILNAPTNITLTDSQQTSLSFSWTDNSILESGYVVERSLDGINWEVLTAIDADSTSFSSLGLSCSTNYQYRLRSYDNATNSYSPYGTSGVFTTAACSPLVPSVLSSTGATETSIGLSWTVDNNATSFTLAYFDGAAWQNLGIFPATTTSYNHSGLVCGTSYQYKVTTYRVNDNSSVESNILPVSTSTCPAPNSPDAPIVLASDLSAISLQIPALPAGASSMNLEQSSDGVNWMSLGAVSQGNFAATGLLCGTTYQYRLVAYSSNGLASAPSASAIGTTTACPTPSLIGVYRAGLWIIVSSDNPSVVLNSFTFGDATWQPIVGDWDGDGVEGVGIYRNGEFILKNLPSADSPDIPLSFGLVEDGWQAIAGDWNGDGIDSVGLYKNGVFSLSDDNQLEAYHFDLGVQGGWMVTAGDWNGDGSDGVAVYKQGEWRLVESVTNPAAVQTLNYGPNQGGWRIIVGDWNNDNSDSIGLFKAGAWRIRTNSAYDASEISVSFGQEGDIPFVIEGSAVPTIFVVP